MNVTSPPAEGAPAAASFVFEPLAYSAPLMSESEGHWL